MKELILYHSFCDRKYELERHYSKLNYVEKKFRDKNDFKELAILLAYMKEFGALGIKTLVYSQMDKKRVKKLFGYNKDEIATNETELRKKGKKVKCFLSDYRYSASTPEHLQNIEFFVGDLHLEALSEPEMIKSLSTVCGNLYLPNKINIQDTNIQMITGKLCIYSKKEYEASDFSKIEIKGGIEVIRHKAFEHVKARGNR